MKNILLLFILLVPAFLFAQYPATGNKQRLGYQTTGDGLIWRGVAADTAIKPRTTANAYFQLDTVNRVLRRYIATQGSWQVVGGGTNVDSLIYATRYWVNSNFFPLEGGTLTGTGGAGFIGFPSQVSAPGTPASGLNVYAQGSSFNWKGTDGYERQFASTLTGGRTYTLPDVSGTFALGTGTADRSARWSATNTLATGNFTDNGTKVQALLPFQLQQWTTAGRPTGVTGYEGYNTTDNGPEWYQGSRWAKVPESTFARGTSTYIPFFDANGQLTQASTTGQNLRYYNNGFANLLEASSAIAAKGVSGLNGGNADIGVISATGNGFWTFSASESTGAFSFFDGASSQSPFIISKNSGNNRLLIQPTTTSLSASSSITNTVGSSIETLGSITDAVGATGQWRIINGNNIVSYSPFSTSPYFAITNGTQRGYIQATSIDGFRVGTVSAHPLVFVTNSTVKAQLTSSGLFGINETNPQRLLHVSGEVRITDLTTDTPTRIVGADSDGDLADVTWLNPASNSLGIGTTPTQELDVNGDAYIRDSTRLTTTPAHSAITGLLTRDANGWIGLASLAGGLSYSGGVLSASGVNTVYTASDSISGDRYLEMANDGSATTAIGHFPDFPDLDLNQNGVNGLYISPQYWGQTGFFNTDSGIKNEMFLSSSGGAMRARNFSNFREGSVSFGLGRVALRGLGNTTSSKDFQFIVDSTRILIARNISGTTYNYELVPNSQYPSTTSSYKTVLQWTGNGSSANPAFVEVKRDTTIFVSSDSDYDFSAALTTAQVGARYNRVIFWMTTTGGAGSDSEITLHTPDANLMQVEYLIHSVDEAGGFANVIRFGTNNAVDSTNGLVSSYFPAAGDGVHIRAGLRSGVYKYRYSN